MANDNEIELDATLLDEDIDERMCGSFMAQADLFELLGVDADDVISALLNTAASMAMKEDKQAFMQAAEIIFDFHHEDRDTIRDGCN